MSFTKKIGIDARFFGPQDKGFGRYTENLIRNLEKLDKQNKYFVFLRPNRATAYHSQNPNFQKVIVNYRWYGLKEQLFYPFKLRKYNLDLMHFTHFNVPFFYHRPFIVTIHDLTLRHFPTFKKSLGRFLIYPLKYLGYRIIFRRAVRRSTKIIAISEHTKKDILKYYQVNPEKIKVIYEGRPENLKGKRQNAKQRLKTKKPYLLYVGNNYPHKNLKRLEMAFKKLAEEGLAYELILTTKFVSEEKLDNLYKNASLFVFPSLYEGFGLPPLEAMSRGIAVASSEATCLPEILGEAAIYFNPLEVDDIARQIKKVLTNKNLKQDLIKKGFEQIKKYDWKKMTRKTLALYQDTF